MSLIAKDTFLVKYRQLNDKKLFQPQSNIYWSEQRLEKYITDNDLKNESKMKTIEARRYSDDEQTVDIHFSSSNDNFGQIFYIKLNARFYWAYQISKEWVAGVARVRLQLELISSLVNLINKGYLGGVWYLLQGHLITREFNTIHSDNCNSIESKINDNIILEKEINNKINYYWFNKDGQDIINKDLRFGANSCSDTSNIKISYREIGTILYNKSNGNLLSYSPLKISSDIFDFTPLGFKDSRDRVNSLLKPDFKWENVTWQLKDNIDCKDFINILLNFPNYKWKQGLQKQLQNIFTEKKSMKWFLLPNIFDGLNENAPIAFTSIDISFLKKQINWKDNNHLILRHYEIKIFITEAIELNLSILELIKNNWMIFIKRIIDYNGVSLKFYYNQNYSVAFSTIILNPEQGLSWDSWQSKQDNLGISYEAGEKTQRRLSIGENLIQTAKSGAIGFLAGNQFGWINLISQIGGSIIAEGFKELSNTYKKYYDELDYRAKPREIKNIPLYEYTASILSENIINAKLFEFKNNNNNFSYGFEIINEIEVKNNKNWVLIISKPDKNDINNIILDQKLYGNVINLITEIDNPLKIINDDFNYIKGTFNFSNTGGYKEFSYSELQYLRDKFLQGICVLNKADEWK